MLRKTGWGSEARWERLRADYFALFKYITVAAHSAEQMTAGPKPVFTPVTVGENAEIDGGVIIINRYVSAADSRP